MAVTIYKALNYSDQIVEATIHMLQKHEKLLTSALYVKNIHKFAVLELADESVLYNIVAKIVVSGAWKDVIESYTLENGSWVQINPKNIVINEEWKTLATFGTYDGG